METAKQVKDAMSASVEKQAESIKDYLRSLGFTEFSVNYQVVLRESKLDRPDHAFLFIQADLQPWTDQ
jgi:hypothetical protein